MAWTPAHSRAPRKHQEGRIFSPCSWDPHLVAFSTALFPGQVAPLFLLIAPLPALHSLFPSLLHPLSSPFLSPSQPKAISVHPKTSFPLKGDQT